MSELLSGGKIHKFPCEKLDGSTFSITEITSQGANNYVLDIVNEFETMPFVLNEFVYLHGFHNGEYTHPLKCKVRETQSHFSALSIENVSGFVMPTLGTYPNICGLFVSRNYASDLLSSKQSNVFDFEVYEFLTGLFPSDGQVVKFAIFDGVPAVDYDFFKIKMVESTTGQILYLTKSVYLISTGVYGFVDDLSQVIGTSFETNSEMTIQHVDCKYTVDVYSDDLLVANMVYSPDKDFRFSFNMRPIFDSLFNESLFTSTTDPLSSSFSDLIDKSSTFVKKVRFDITLTSPNLNGNRSNSFQFFTAPFKSTTGRGTLEQFLPPIDLQPVPYLLMTPFSKAGGGVIPYLNGTGGVLGFVGLFVRNRDKSNLKVVNFGDFITVATANIATDGISFLMYSRKYTSSQAPSVVYVEDENEMLITTFALKNNGLYCNQVNIIWQSPSGLGQYFFNQEYDETNTVDGMITIVNDEENTIVNHNIKTKRRLSLKTGIIGIDERIGIASLIEAKQVWIYSYTQQRLFPCKIVTNTMKIRQRDEIKSVIDFEIEIEAGVIL